MKLIYAALASAILTACGGGGGTGDTGAAPTSPVGGDGSTSSEIIAFTNGDYYTFKNERTTIKNGVGIENSTSYYTYTIKDPLPDGSHQRYETSPSGEMVLDFYNHNNFRISEIYKNFSCTFTDGLDNPTFQMKIGQKWDSNYSRKCSVESNTLPANFHSTGTITSKDSIKTEAGDFISYRADRVKEQIGTSTLKGSCWYDEKTSIITLCDQSSFYSSTGTTGTTTTEIRSKITLIGINAKNHPIKKHTVATYYGNWQFKFTGEDPGQCLATISPGGSLSGQCTTRTESFAVSGFIRQEGGFEANGTNGIKIQGTLNSPVESSGTWFSTTYNNISGTWTATHL